MGCDKLFIHRSYEQIIAFPTSKTFVCLKEEYLGIVIDEKKKCKGLSVYEKSVRIKNINYSKVIAKSTNR